MDYTKVLILELSLTVRRFHQFLIHDEYLRCVEDLGINSHAIRYKGTGRGGGVPLMVFYGTMYNLPFNKRAQLDCIILMVGGNDVRR